MGVHVILTVAWVREPIPVINGPPGDACPYIFIIFSVNFPPTKL